MPPKLPAAIKTYYEALAAIGNRSGGGSDKHGWGLVGPMRDHRCA